MKKSIAKILKSIANRLGKQENIAENKKKSIYIDNTYKLYPTCSSKQIAFENFQKSEKIFYTLKAGKKDAEAEKYHKDVVMKNYYAWKSI